MNRYAILYAALPLIDFFSVEVVAAFVVVSPVVGNETMFEVYKNDGMKIKMGGCDEIDLKL